MSFGRGGRATEGAGRPTSLRLSTSLGLMHRGGAGCERSTQQRARSLVGAPRLRASQRLRRFDYEVHGEDWQDKCSVYTTQPRSRGRIAFGRRATLVQKDADRQRQRVFGEHAAACGTCTTT